MQKGYSYATISRNIAELVASGYERNEAVRIASDAGRCAYFRRYPGGALPNYLTYPGSGRTKAYYTESGKPIKMKRNPAKRKTKNTLKKAAKLIQDFSGHKARVLGSVKAPIMPKTAIAIGELIGVAYRTKRDGVVENYFHKFNRRNSRPLLVVTPDGKQLIIVGGQYNFTERGIVDRVKH